MRFVPAREKCLRILFLLESKYDVLTQVCQEYEDWKEATSTADFDLLWCDTAIPADRFMKLKTFQKMNHFVGMSSITRKNNLGRNLLRMRKQFPKEYRFFPDTWILPTDMSDFKQQFTNVKKQTFIIKPDNGCQGKGIFLIRDVEKVPVDFSSTFVAQRYISKPLLLDGYKFDLRLYVLVSGCDPLRIFLHRKGLVRLASEQYVEPTKNNLSEVMVHLTNYAINKANPNFEENTNPDDAEDGHKRSWEAVQEHLRREGHDVDTLILEIEDLIIKTLIAVQPSLSHFYHSCQPEDVDNGMCFEILGFDVMLDQKLQPWLLEVNHAPSFATESELDHQVKHEVLQDSFNLLDLNPELRRQKKREARERMEQRSMGMGKQKSPIEDRIAQEREFALVRTDWEDAQLKSTSSGYKRLYPSPEKEKEYWQVHDAAINIWEMMMGGTFRRAVRLCDPGERPEESKGGSMAPGLRAIKLHKNRQKATIFQAMATFTAKISVPLCVLLVLGVAVAALRALAQLEPQALDVATSPATLGTALLQAAAAMLWVWTLYCSYSDTTGLAILHRGRTVYVRHLGRFITFTLWCNCVLALYWIFSTVAALMSLGGLQVPVVPQRMLRAATLHPAALADLWPVVLVGLHCRDLCSAACGLCQRTCKGGRDVGLEAASATQWIYSVLCLGIGDFPTTNACRALSADDPLWSLLYHLRLGALHALRNLRLLFPGSNLCLCSCGLCVAFGSYHCFLCPQHLDDRTETSRLWSTNRR
eukprot:s2088_g8.t1